MSLVKTTNFFGILIRKDSIKSKNLNIADIKAMIETALLDENEELLSFGPCFGEEAAANLSKKLENKGLEYVDDYFIFQGDFPEWLSFSVGFVKPTNSQN